MIRIGKLYKTIKHLIEYWKRTNRIEELYFKDKWLDCIAECRSAMDLGKTDFFVYYYLGLSKAKLNFLDESTESLEQALAMPGSEKQKKAIKDYHSYAKYEISANYRKQRKYEQAINQLDNCIREEPHYLNYYYLKANIYEDLEKIELAIEAVSKGLTIDPKNKELLELQKHLAYLYSLEQSEKRNGGVIKYK